MPTDLQYEEFISHLPVAASDRTLMALKGHLLVEQALRTFIESRVAQPERIKDKQIQFSALIDFASSLARQGEIDWIWSSLRTLNQFRNTLAHKLSPAKTDEIEKKFIDHVRNHDGQLSVFVGKSKLTYGEFPLAVFQVYDILLSAAHAETAKQPEDPPKNFYTDDMITTAITRAFIAVDGSCFNRKLHGPQSRKKWPNPK